MKKLINFFFILLLMISLLYLGYSKFFQKNAVVNSDPEKAPLVFDEYLYHATMRQFDESGKLAKEIKLESWRHFPKTHISQFINPTMHLFEHNHFWKIQADEGCAPQINLNNKIDTIKLFKNVSIENNSKKNDTWKLTTPSLWFYLNEHRSETQDEVNIFKSNLHISGKGAVALLADGQFKILNQVKTIYDDTSN